MNLKRLALLFILITAIIACNNDDDNNDSFDAAGQAIIDDEILVDYLKSHYYIEAEPGEVFGDIDTIMNNESSLFDDARLKTESAIENDITYKYYYFEDKEGSEVAPEKTDSVLVNYRGFLLDSTNFDERLSYTWLSLTNVIRGWSHGFVNFKAGVNSTTPGEPVSFSDTGSGILFLPSGLAYGNLGNPGIPPNEPLIFHIRLGLVERADHDGDRLLSSYEDLDNDGNPNNDDSDGDGGPDYLDSDDDNDGVPTRDELELKTYVIAIGEDEPTLASNEFEYDRMEDDMNITIYTAVVTDSNNDGTPDYLDENEN